MRILAIADEVSPFVYSENFPGNLPPIDLILSAGDMPGHVLEFLATKTKIPPVYVLGNHGNGYVPRTDGLGGDGGWGTEPAQLPGGCINAHLRVVEIGGVLVAGIEGSGRYRPGPHQYSEFEMETLASRFVTRFAWNRLRRGRALDVLLTHAPPVGPHAGDDHPHRGIPAFNRIHRWWKPRLHVHGHVHLSGSNAARTYTSEEGVRVVNAFGFTLIELDDT